MRAKELIRAKDQVIFYCEGKISDLEFDLLKVKSANHMRGLFEFFEDKLREKHYKDGVPVGATMKDRWGHYLEKDGEFG